MDVMTFKDLRTADDLHPVLSDTYLWLLLTLRRALVHAGGHYLMCPGWLVPHLRADTWY